MVFENGTVYTRANRHSFFCTLRKHHPEKPADTAFKLFCGVYFPLISAAKACREMDYLLIQMA
jgi:hypothetical protein